MSVLSKILVYPSHLASSTIASTANPFSSMPFSRHSVPEHGLARAVPHNEDLDRTLLGIRLILARHVASVADKRVIEQHRRGLVQAVLMSGVSKLSSSSLNTMVAPRPVRCVGDAVVQTVAAGGCFWCRKRLHHCSLLLHLCLELICLVSSRFDFVGSVDSISPETTAFISER